MKSVTFLLALIGTISVSSAQATNDKNNLINCISCIDQGKNWDDFNTNCVSSESIKYTTTFQGCLTIKVLTVTDETTTVSNEMQLEGIKNRYRDLPKALIFTNMRYVVVNEYSKDINMWVKCNDETKVLLYATEGES